MGLSPSRQTFCPQTLNNPINVHAQHHALVTLVELLRDDHPTDHVLTNGLPHNGTGAGFA